MIAEEEKEVPAIGANPSFEDIQAHLF